MFFASCKKVGKGGRRLADFSFGIGSRFTTLNYIGGGWVRSSTHAFVGVTRYDELSDVDSC
jgi:hypothetical protein